METDPESFDAFRRQHASDRGAFDACDRPDWLIRLALSVAPHEDAKRQVLRLGAQTARYLHASNLHTFATLFVPVPTTIEVVAAWANGIDALSTSSLNVRAAVSPECHFEIRNSIISAIPPAPALTEHITQENVTPDEDGWVASHPGLGPAQGMLGAS